MDKEKLLKAFSKNVLKELSEWELNNLKISYCFRPRKDESPELLKFLIMQSNLNDALRFLIEKEISENGIRDISECIPAFRGKSFFNKKTNNSTDTSSDEKAMTQLTNETDSNSNRLAQDSTNGNEEKVINQNLSKGDTEIQSPNLNQDDYKEQNEEEHEEDEIPPGYL